MDDGALRWGTLLETLRVLRDWSREELAAASGVSAATIALQEQGAVNPTRGVREKLEEALGVVGREPELEALGELRAWMLDPEGRYWTGRSEGAGEEAQRILKVALRLGLDHLERIEPSIVEAESNSGLPWPLLLVTLRTLRGWSQEELESASGLATGMISKQEAGRRKPSKAIREKIDDGLPGPREDVGGPVPSQGASRGDAPSKAAVPESEGGRGRRGDPADRGGRASPGVRGSADYGRGEHRRSGPPSRRGGLGPSPCLGLVSAVTDRLAETLVKTYSRNRVEGGDSMDGVSVILRA